MKGFDLTQVICEVVSGLTGMFLFFGFLDFIGHQDIISILLWFNKYMTFSLAIGLIIFAYLIGLIIDAFGLAFDRLIDCFMNIPEIDDASLKGFYSKTSWFVFSYWHEQWVFYSLYRNLLMLMLPGIILFVSISSKYWSFVGGLIAFVITLILLIILWLALIDLKTIYNRIPSRFK